MRVYTDSLYSLLISLYLLENLLCVMAFQLVYIYVLDFVAFAEVGVYQKYQHKTCVVVAFSFNNFISFNTTFVFINFIKFYQIKPA